jgi:hypothetical protein
MIGRKYLKRGEREPEQEPDENDDISELPGRVRPAPLQPQCPEPSEGDNAPEDQNVFQDGEHLQAPQPVSSPQPRHRVLRFHSEGETMLVHVPDNVKEATTDSSRPDVTAIPHEFISSHASRSGMRVDRLQDV